MSFPLREAMRLKARELKSEGDKIIRQAASSADQRGSLEVDEENGRIFFDGEIGEAYLGGIDGPMMRDALSRFRGRPVTIHMNSPGGSVDVGLSVYAALKDYKAGVTIIAELAASMGSLILQAAGKRVMTRSGMVMLHAPWTVAAGDAAEFERRAEMLRKYGERLIPIYAERTRKTEDQIREMFLGETWLNAEEAVEHGFADEIQSPKRYPRATLAKVRAASLRNDAEHREILAKYGLD